MICEHCGKPIYNAETGPSEQAFRHVGTDEQMCEGGETSAYPKVFKVRITHSIGGYLY